MGEGVVPTEEGSSALSLQSTRGTTHLMIQIDQ